MLLREPIFFDYSQEKPSAKITLSAAEKQWEYTDEKRNHNTHKNRERFLRNGVSYVISMDVVLAKSSKNRELGKFMLDTRAIDSSGTSVASSSRPIIVPYQSKITKTLEGFVFWPFREMGLMKSSESIQVREELMNNYLENYKPTDKFEFTLSTNVADIEGVYLSIFPRLNMLSNFMFYHPNLSTIIGVCLIAIVEAMACIVIFSVYFLMKYLTNPEGLRRAYDDSEIDSFDSDEEEYYFVSEDSDELFEGSSEGNGESGEEEDYVVDDDDDDDDDDESGEVEDQEGAEINDYDEIDENGFMSDGLRRRR